MGFANKMSESIIAERLYWCSRNTILFANCSQIVRKLFANCSQIKEKAPTKSLQVLDFQCGPAWA